MKTRPFLSLAFAAGLAATGFAQSTYNRNLPDHDQKRNALGGNGKNHCVPTTYSDLLRFMANCGLTNLDSTYTSSYSSTTSFINVLGNKMDTDPEGGTNWSDGFDAIVDWIDDHSNAYYMHFGYSTDGNWGTGTMRNWMAMGAMIRLGYGRYHKEGSDYERKNGHAVAMAGYDWRNATRAIFVSDPASDDGNINAQGAFTHDKKNVWNVDINTDDDGWVTHARYTNWTGDDGKWRAIIDQMHVILPIWGGWVNAPHTEEPTLWTMLDGTALTVAPATFHAVFPNPLVDGKNTPIKEIDIPLPGSVKDWCIDTGDTAIYTLGEDGTINHIDLMTKETKRVAAVRGARKLAVAGKNFDLYVLQDGAQEDQLLRIKPLTGKMTSLKVAKGISSIEPDQATFGIAALHPMQKRLYKIDAGLKMARPQAIDLPEGTGGLYLAPAKAGEFTLARSGVSTMIRAGLTSGNQRLTMARAPQIQAFQTLGRGRFLVQEGTKLTAVDADGKTIASPFDDVRATAPIRVAQSWKAFTKADVSGPGWKEVLPKPGEP